MSLVVSKGRYCNVLIQNLAVNFIAKKHNLFVNYANEKDYNKIGITFFCGEKKYNETKELTDSNYEQIYNSENIDYNVETPKYTEYYQTRFISNLIYNHINLNLRNDIIQNNQFKDRYNNNNDCIIHIRLGDICQFNPGNVYYDRALNRVSFDKLYIATDSRDHDIVISLLRRFPIDIINLDEIDTLKFGSTCKHIILSHGTYSATLGYLGFYSNIYYPKINPDRTWHGDIFSIPGWNEVNY